MPQSLALSDLVAPYLLKGQNLNAFHALFSVLRVVSYETAADPFGIVLRGRAEFQGRLSIPGANGALFTFVNDETDPPFNPSAREPIFDIAETSIGFELFAPRVASAAIAGGAAQLAGDAAFAPVAAVLADWDAAPLDAPPSDYPTSGFVLDLIVNSPTVRPPGLRPAQMTADGLLAPDTSFSEVTFSLPKLRFRLSHDVNANGRLRFELQSFGVESLDDPTDIGAGEFISMVPTYAIIEGKGLGIGFRGGVLDLSQESTPPDVLEKTGVGDDWSGIYLPELRLFISGGRNGYAYQFGVRDFLYGFGPAGGISGDFEAAVFAAGGADLKLGARFFDGNGRGYGLLDREEYKASVVLPEKTRMVVDIEGGRTPYAVNATVGGGPPMAAQLLNVDLALSPKTTAVITVTDSSVPTPMTRTLTIDIVRGDPRQVIVTPGTSPEPPKRAEITVAAGQDPVIVVKAQDDRYVTLTTNPADANTRWSLDSGPEGTARASFTVEVPGGASHLVAASLPGVPSLPGVEVFYYFDRPEKAGPGNADPQIGDSVRSAQRAWTTKAKGRTEASGREDGGHRPVTGGDHPAIFNAAPGSTKIKIVGDASFEGDRSKLEHNYELARRRAIAAKELIKSDHSKFTEASFDVLPAPWSSRSDPAVVAWEGVWSTRSTDEDTLPQWWVANITFTPDPGRPAKSSQATITRPTSSPGTPAEIKVVDPPVPNPPDRPPWFRSASVKLRVIEDRFVAIQIDGEIDVQTAAETTLSKTGQVEGQTPERVRTLANGSPLAPDNPADGITAFRFLLQENEMTGEMAVSFSIGADPADADGLLAVGWIPGEARAPTTFWRDLLGSYISFWPLLADAADRDVGSPVDAVIDGAALLIPPTIAALPWFTVERIILHGAEYTARWQTVGSEAIIYFDLAVDWSVALPSESAFLIRIDPQAPLEVRYKAIGLRLADYDEDGTPTPGRYDFRPVFDSSRGYAIGIANNGGGITLRPPLDRIMKVLSARLSRINPLLFEIDIGMAVDFGVVSFDRLGVRARLTEPTSIEITAIGVSVDIPAAISGQGYLAIAESKIGGQLDLTVTAIGLRVAGALEIADIPADAGGPATGLYIGLDLTLPVGIPLANSGLGIFGFRGLFGMHYARTPIGADKPIPSLEWLKAAGGRPNLLVNNGVVLWEPMIDRWSFGVGVMIGTMEGGFLLNLDGTLLLELPGPNIIIALSARFLSPPPSIDEAGGVGGILAVIEITPQHIAIGIYVTYDIEKLIEIKIPAEALFPTGGDMSKWHFYLGARPDVPGPGPIVVRVLGIVDGTGYLMLRGEGLPAYGELPAVSGFAVGLGAGASFIWGDTDIGLYLKVGGGMDAVVGFDPLMLAGTLKVFGELRLFIVSVGADATLTVIVQEQGEGFPIGLRVDGKACGHVEFFFFEISECVSISFGDAGDEPAVPGLVGKVSLQSRSPALAQGSGVDRPIDASLGEAPQGVGPPGEGLPVVPIDSVPIISMLAPPAIDGAQFMGAPVSAPPNAGPPPGFVDRGGERYGYALKTLTLERVDGNGAAIAPTLLGAATPHRWWTQNGATGDPSAAHLALLTWELDPAPKAIETSDKRTETIRERWGSVCEDASPPAPVFWTFRLEPLGPSAAGWALAGIPWPDPPSTKRSTPADPELFVHETWRSGIGWVDGARGVIPAVVIGAPVPCRHRPKRPFDVADYVLIGGRGPGVSLERAMASSGRLGGAPIGGSAARGFELMRNAAAARNYDLLSTVIPAEGALVGGLRLPEAYFEKATAPQASAKAERDQVATLAALARGDDVTRAEILSALSPFGAQPSRSGLDCETRVLQSPLLDDGTLVRFGLPSKVEAVSKALAEAGVSHGPLDDVIALETGGFQHLRLLLFISLFERTATYVVRVLDSQGVELERKIITAADRVPPKPLPAHWTDPSGPWAADVADVLSVVFTASRMDGSVAVLVELHEHKDAARVEIGVVRTQAPNAWKTLHPFYLAAIEMLRMAEVYRHDFDQTSIDREREVVTEFLGPASTDNAFLAPASLYRCTVGWTGERERTGTVSGEITQTFWFRTDSEPPARLDPFVLMTEPAEGEKHYFAGEPPRIVFNTHDIDRLWGAYGRELKVRFQASSGRQPASTAPSDVSQLAIGPPTLIPAGAAVLSPFEDALSAMLEGKCIPVDKNRMRQSVVEIDVPLEPFTDYIMDVVAVPTGQAVSHDTQFIYRRRFSTGAYAGFEQFGASIATLTIGHRGVAPGTVATHLGGFASQAPLGQELDQALRNAGFDVDGAPRLPKVTVVWEQQGANLPQPVGLLVDSDEPLWRSRPYPEKVDDPDALPGTKRWKLVDKLWLALQAEPASAGLLKAPPIPAPGAQRALILLNDGARGKRLQLELVRLPFPEPYLGVAELRRIVVDVMLTCAPWED